MKKTFLIALLSLSIFVVTGVFMVQATTTDSNTDIVKLVNPFRGGDSLFALLKTVINNILLPIGGVLAVLAFIYSGFLYVTAQGNETKLKTAHQALLYTAIGTAILLGSWVLASVICNT
ncbi:MAG: hypothetical protein WD896_00865, partial [Parcubacteria group bacterium]